MKQPGPLWLLTFFLVALCQAQHWDDDDFDGFDGDGDGPFAEHRGKVDSAPQRVEPPRVTDKPSSAHDEASMDKIQILELEAPVRFDDPLRGYHWEAFVIFLCVFYVGFYVYGRLQNESIAEDWMRNSLHLLREEFALIGEGDDPSRLIARQSDALYRTWVSGRKNTDGILIELHLSRRFCALQTVMSLGRAQDICSYTVDFSDDELDTFVLLVYFDKRIPRKAVAKRLAEYQDLAQFCREGKNVRENWRIFTELGEPSEAIQADTRVQSMASRGLLRMVHVSDRYQRGQSTVVTAGSGQPNFSRRMYLEFNLSCDEQDDLDCLKFVLYLIDKFSQYRLCREAKQRASRNRQIADEQNRKTESKHRQELAKRRREERLREEKRKVENDPELLRKLEEKQHKKEIRRKQQKTKQILVKSF